MTNTKLLSLLAVTTMILSSNAFALSSGTLGVQGTVAIVNNISITASGVYNTLNITGGESNSTVASVDETSNDLLGYHITMASANAGQLQNGSDVSKKTTYTISYNAASAVAPTASAQTVKNVASLVGLTTNTSSVKINVAAYATAPAGVYSDTLTFAIVAN